MHDPDCCLCGLDPIEESPTGPLCPCPCPDCTAKRAAVVGLWKRKALEKRLKSAGIDVETFADLLWMHLEPTIEREVERMAKDAVKRALQGMRIVSNGHWRD